jgi:tetratricopeptide (TPR) repeat protein
MLPVQLAEVRSMSPVPTQRTELARAKHQQALELTDKQQLPGALRLFGEALTQEETCERWNDWAVAQFTRNQFAEAEQGFRYALELDPANLEVAGNLGVLLVECEREHEAIPFLARAASAENTAASSRSTAEVLATISRDTVANWGAEFEIQLREKRAPLSEIPRWPLTKYAVRLAQLGEFGNALEMVQYNRHFQPADMELIRMEAALRAIIAKKPESTRSEQGTIPA